MYLIDNENYWINIAKFDNYNLNNYMYLIDNKNYWRNIAKRDIYNLINYMMLIYVGYKYIKMRRFA